MKRCLVLGAGGFIGWHLAKRLHEEGSYVVGVDIKDPEFERFVGTTFIRSDLRNEDFVKGLMMMNFDELYQLAADMGGAGFVFTGEHDSEILMNNAQININVARYAHMAGRVFYSSSACVYGPHLSTKEGFAEENAYPACPDSEYGWEKLFSEHLYLSQKNAVVRIARFHNVYGPYGTWRGGREKSPAALCRKVAESSDPGIIEIWGNGAQVRSYLYIDDCIDGVLALMRSPVTGPLNIGSEDAVSIDALATLIMSKSGKALDIKYVPGPIGVSRRQSNNDRTKELIGWEPKIPLHIGIARTYAWIKDQAELSAGKIQENMK
jgi:nucleoside-diphosphate-sugar epimerase